MAMNSTIKQVCAVLLLVCAMVQAAAPTQPAPTIKWSAKDSGGADVTIPVDRPSIVAFIRADQDQSKEAIKQIQKVLPDLKAAQIIVILSGPLAAEQARQMAGDTLKGLPVVADPEFTASGTMNIHVWPTTLVVKSDGTQVAHLAGMPRTFSTDLLAYLDFASGKLDEAALQKRLTTQDVVTDSPQQIAARHLQVAQRLLEQGHPDQAKPELTEGLKNVPQDSMLLLAMARVDVLLNQPKDAMDILDKLPAGTAPGWQSSLIRARALIGLERWSDAKAILPDALKLNPDPAEAHYLFGLCYQHDQDWAHASEQFRLAFEKTSAGSKTAVPAASK